MASPSLSFRLNPYSSEFIPIPISSEYVVSNPLLPKKNASDASSSTALVAPSLSEMMSTLNHSLSDLGFPILSTGSFHVAVDWKETSVTHVIKAAVPGFTKEQVKIEMEDDGRVLIISGEKKAEKKDQQEGEKVMLAEMGSGKFCRKFNLPENAKVDEIDATIKDGVLTVTIPKVEVPKKNLKSIKISAA